MHRLKQTSRVIPGFGVLTTDFGFDAVGNIQKKTDFSAASDNAYHYLPVGTVRSAANGWAGPNAPRTVSLASGTRTYDYDKNGNLVSDGLRDIRYNAFNKPTVITVNGGTINPALDTEPTTGSEAYLYYGADQMRYKQEKVSNGETTTHLYIGKLYETVTRKDAAGVILSTQEKSYLDEVAVINETTDNGNTTHEIAYYHRDRLGSMTAEIGDIGQMIQAHSFDAFGRPRNENLSDKDSLQQLQGVSTHRGFTDHEHLDDSQLIHMNGRVYDYNLGRFLSVDPLIQEPGNSQSMNPY